ncbi:MAG: hypothetical protein IJ420_00560 [Lachnospiraceae bacterium]|nr:hypothetical protein [Lachnospiraceae bacterium]
MILIDCISFFVMGPVVLYGCIVFYSLVAGWLSLLFRSTTMQAYQNMIRRDLRLSESFIIGSKKFFWTTYSPIFLFVVVLRFMFPFDYELFAGRLFPIVASISYVLVLLFSGYMFPKENRAERNFNSICREITAIIDGYQSACPDNHLEDYHYFINDALDEYENAGKCMYKRFVDVVECKKTAHVLLLSTLYDFLISGEWKWSEGSKKCSCDFFAYVAKISLQNNYVDKQIIVRYVTEINKQK